MTKSMILFAVMACGHTAPASAPVIGTQAASRSPPQASPAVTSATKLDDALTVRMQLRARRGRTTFDVAPDDTLHSHDYIELRVAANVRAYVYVVQFDPHGNSKLLFPDDGDIMLAPDVPTRIPPASEDWYQLDDDTGTETIYIVASREPIARIDEALGNEIRAIRDIAAPAPVPASIEVQRPTPRLGASLPRRTTRPRRMLTLANRGLRKVVASGDQSIVDTAVPVQNDGLVVAWFSFHHVH